jgi:hypothetical protein
MYKCNFFTCSLRNTILALCFPKPICEGVNLSGTWIRPWGTRDSWKENIQVNLRWLYNMYDSSYRRNFDLDKKNDNGTIAGKSILKWEKLQRLVANCCKMRKIVSFCKSNYTHLDIPVLKCQLQAQSFVDSRSKVSVSKSVLLGFPIESFDDCGWEIPWKTFINWCLSQLTEWSF